MTYLTYSDRKIIERMLRDGESHRSIAKVLGRGKSTISEEIVKNQMEWEEYYKAGSSVGYPSVSFQARREDKF
jgi:IS30 family transposase